MPKLNPNTGRALQGKAGGPASIDGKLVRQVGGEANWLDDDTIIYQTVENGVWFLETLHVPTGLRTPILPKQGANFIAAGGGRWVAWLGEGAVGVYGDIVNAGAGIRDVSTDGTIALVDSYQEGLGCTLYSKDGRVTRGPKDAMYSFTVLGPTSAIWAVNGEIRALNARVPAVQIGNVQNGLKRMVVGEVEWISYWSDQIGLVLHPYNSPEGYILETTGHAFWNDAIAWHDKIRVAFSWNQGEAPDELVVIDVDLSAPRVNLLGGKVLAPGEVVGKPLTQRVFLTGDLTASLAATSSADDTIITPQLGLLEDDIVYRLSLLAANILQPLKDRYPNIVIISGFRQTNSGIGQHELGEAVDIQLSNQTTLSLYEMAAYIRDTLSFDQLVLNFTLIGDQKPWVHVSFSPKSLRRQVITKDFADTFHPGLAIVEPVTGEAAATILRNQAASDTLILTEMTKLQNRQQRLATPIVYSDDVTATTNLVGSSDGGGSTLPADAPNMISVLQQVLDSGTWQLGELYEDETYGRGAFTEAAVNALHAQDAQWGHIQKSGGQNHYNGHAVDAINWKNPDGMTAEIYDIVSGSGSIQWGFSSRSANALRLWYF